ncbi:MAG: hypothetical protein ACTSRZ_19185 [Promethearchaeota archaeon]
MELEIFDGSSLILAINSMNFEKNIPQFRLNIVNIFSNSIYNLSIKPLTMPVLKIKPNYVFIKELHAGQSKQFTFYLIPDQTITSEKFSIKYNIFFTNSNLDEFCANSEILNFIIKDPYSIKFSKISLWKNDYLKSFNFDYMLEIKDYNNHLKISSFIRELFKKDIIIPLQANISLFNGTNEEYILFNTEKGQDFILGILYFAEKNKCIIKVWSNESQLIKQLKDRLNLLKIFSNELLSSNNKEIFDRICLSYNLGKYFVTLSDYISIDWDLRDIIFIMKKIIKIIDSIPELQKYKNKFLNWIDFLNKYNKMSDVSNEKKEYMLDSIKNIGLFFEEIYGK